jgi:hypothetical protein
MERTVYHVVGFTQYMGTCKMHLFLDCPQLTKKRLAARQWDRTGVTETTTLDVQARPHRVCQFCLKRDATGAKPVTTPPAGMILLADGHRQN